MCKVAGGRCYNYKTTTIKTRKALDANQACMFLLIRYGDLTVQRYALAAFLHSSVKVWLVMMEWKLHIFGENASRIKMNTLTHINLTSGKCWDKNQHMTRVAKQSMFVLYWLLRRHLSVKECTSRYFSLPFVS